MKKIYLLLGLVSNLTFAQQEYSNLKIKAWSPILHLQRNTNEGGFTQGIQTQLSDETNNWFFGAFGTGSWIVSKGNHDNIKFLVNENGNVGIGTQNPTEKLEVQGNLRVNSLGTHSAIHLGPENNDAIITDGTSNKHYGGGYFFRVHNTQNQYIDALTLTDNGNIGIGTLHPDERLSVEGGIGISRSSNEGAYLSLINPGKTGDNATTWRMYNMTGYYGNSLQFWSYTNDWRGGSKLILSDNGNVGIGTGVPKAKLDIDGFTVLGGHASNLDRAVSVSNKIKDAIANTGKLAIGWNYSGNNGETDFISNRGQGGVGGFSFYDINNDGNINHILNLNSNGNAVLHGKLEAKEIKVTETPTADFVFEEDYALPTLQEVEQHIKEKKHLPEIASAKQMEKDGVNIGEFQIQLLQKIEELTLYIIEQNKSIEKQNEETNKLNNTVLEQQKQINSLNQKIEKISNEK